MNVSVIVDRIVLTHLDLPPTDAHRLKSLIESELKSMIEREGLPSEPQRTAAEISLDLSNGLGEQQLARSVATRLWSTLYGPY